MTDPKRVSMYDAERKSLRLAKIVMVAATLILFAMTYFNLFHTNLYMWQEKAAGLSGVFGIVLFGAALGMIFFESAISNAAKNETLWYILWIICILGGIGVSCGFNFTL